MTTVDPEVKREIDELERRLNALERQITETVDRAIHDLLEIMQEVNTQPSAGSGGSSREE